MADRQLYTRRELADLLGIHPQTVTGWEADGMPIAQHGGRGRASRYDVAAVFTWRVDTARQAADRDGEMLSLEHERARLARAQTEKTERENQVRAGELVERETIILEGQNYTKAWSAKVRNLPRRMAQHGLIPPTAVPGVTQFCRELLLDISSWKAMSDAPRSAGKQTRKERGIDHVANVSGTARRRG